MADDSKNDAVNTPGISKAAHRASSPSDLPESSFDGVSSAYFHSVGHRTIEEVEHLIQVLIQAIDRLRVNRPPFQCPILIGVDRLLSMLGQVYQPGSGQTAFPILDAQFIGDVA